MQLVPAPLNRHQSRTSAGQFQAVVAAQELRGTAFGGEAVQGRHGGISVEAAADLGGQCFAGELVGDVARYQGAPVAGGAELQSRWPTPGSPRWPPAARYPASRSRPGGVCGYCLAPVGPLAAQPGHALVIDLMALGAQQRAQSSIPEPGAAVGPVPAAAPAACRQRHAVVDPRDVGWTVRCPGLGRPSAATPRKWPSRARWLPDAWPGLPCSLDDLLEHRLVQLGSFNSFFNRSRPPTPLAAWPHSGSLHRTDCATGSTWPR